MCIKTSVQEGMSGNSANNDNIPPLARAWLAVYRRVPKVLSLPFASLDMTFVLVSAVFLASVKMLVEFLLIHQFGFPEGLTTTKEAAAAFGSITHSTLLCTALIVAFRSQHYGPTDRLDVAPLWWQDHAHAILQFCTGYMLYDGIINIIWLRLSQGEDFNFDDYLFLCHHFMTSLYMTSARYIEAGHFSAFICMLLGEATNPLQNLYLFLQQAAGLECCNGALTQQALSVVELAFAVQYNIFRGLLAPRYFSPVSYQLLFTKQGRTNVPLPLNILWNFMIWAVLFGSVTWLVKCHGIYMEFFASLQQSEGRSGDL